MQMGMLRTDFDEGAETFRDAGDGEILFGCNAILLCRQESRCHRHQIWACADGGKRWLPSPPRSSCGLTVGHPFSSMWHMGATHIQIVPMWTPARLLNYAFFRLHSSVKNTQGLKTTLLLGQMRAAGEEGECGKTMFACENVLMWIIDVLHAEV